MFCDFFFSGQQLIWGVLSLGGECKHARQPFGCLRFTPSQLCLSFSQPYGKTLRTLLFWGLSHTSGYVWAWGGSVKGSSGQDRTSLKACVFRRIRCIMVVAILSFRYRAQYLAVLTHVCYINPYILSCRVAVQMPLFGHCMARVRTDLCIVFFLKSTDFYYKNI